MMSLKLQDAAQSLLSVTQWNCFHALRDFLERSLRFGLFWTNGGHTISKWYKDNFLKGNYDKYNLMLLGRKNKNEDSPSINVKIDEQVIKSSPDLKLLGVTLDDELSFSTHISDICKMASKKVGVLVRLRNMIPREAKLQLYKSAILPN